MAELDGGLATGPTVAAAPTPVRGRDPVAEVLPDRLVEGDAVGDYVIERFLGAGAMGDVYAGRHPVIGKRVAIKVLKRELASDKEASERFIREAKAVNQIDHPNVIDVFNFGQLKGNDGRLFLVMDLVDGRSLRKLLEDGPVALDVALGLLAQIADALDAAHARGVIHRDLKPDNAMVSADGSKVFVLDFGIAKLFSATATGSGTLTGKGTWLGTPGYMAPEQWSAEGATPASDRYALGVMAYELISGVLPFKAPTLPQMMEQHFRAPVPALSSKGVPRTIEHHAALDRVLARALAKHPDERFPTGKALVEALRAAAAGKPVAGLPAKRSLAIPAIAGTAVLGLGIVGALAIRSKDGDDEARPRPATSSSVTEDRTKIAIEITTRPPRATVSRDGVQLGQTPFRREIDAGGKGVLTIARPGFRSITETVSFDQPITISRDLQPILGFEGVWAMPDGKLRGFWRKDDKVDVFQLESVTGARQLWRTCELVPGPAGKDVVVFATTADMIDERAADGEAGCVNPHGIEYTFDPEASTLAVRVEQLEVTRSHGHCEVVSKKWLPPRMLTRADTTGETRFTEPPVGLPVEVKSRPQFDGDKSNAFNIGNKDKDSNAPVSPKQAPIQKKAATVQKPAPPSKPLPKTKASPGNADEELTKKAIQKSEVVPNVPAPQPQAQAPQLPRGDSQAAK